MCPLSIAIPLANMPEGLTQTPVAFMFIAVADASTLEETNIDQNDNVTAEQQQNDHLSKTSTTC